MPLGSRKQPSWDSWETGCCCRRRLAQRPQPADGACCEAVCSPTTGCRTRRLQCLDLLLVNHLQRARAAEPTLLDEASGGADEVCAGMGTTARQRGTGVGVCVCVCVCVCVLRGMCVCVCKETTSGTAPNYNHKHTRRQHPQALSVISTRPPFATSPPPCT